MEDARWVGVDWAERRDVDATMGAERRILASGSDALCRCKEVGRGIKDGPRLGEASFAVEPG
jgi:hypothetical protein